MRGIIRGAAPAGLLAAGLAAGCSAGAPARYEATADTCYAFGVQALQRHVTVTAVPRACAGLSHAQVNLAVSRAIREVAGSYDKVAARHLASRVSAYLERLIRTVPPPRPVPLTIAPARRSSGFPLSLAALAAWIVTAAAGSYLLAGWLADGGPRRVRITGTRPVIIAGHFTAAVAGLGTWIAFLATDVPVLAWVAVAVILPAAGLGMAALAAALLEPAASAGPASPGLPPATRTAQTAAPAGTRIPVTVIAVHGVLATATILLVLLAAIES